MTLRSRLFVAFVAVVGVPLVVGLALLAAALPPAFGRQQQASVATAGRLAAQLVTAECDRARAVAEAAGRAVLSLPPDAVALQQAALDSLLERGLASGLAVTDGQGRTVQAGSVPSQVGDCATGQLDGGRLAAVAELRQGSGQAGRSVAVVRELDTVLRDLQATSGSTAVALGRVGSVLHVAGSLPAGVATSAIATPGRLVQAGSTVAVAEPVRFGGGLFVVVAEPAAGGIEVVRPGVLVVLGAVLLAAAFAFLAARATTRPLEQLSDAAARVAAGNLQTRIEVRSRDEVGRLAAAFNRMTDELRGTFGELAASRDEMRAGLVRLGQALTSTHDLDRMLAVVLDTAVATSAARAGAVLLVDASGTALDLAVGRALEDRVTGPVHLQLGEGIAGRSAQTGEPLSGPTAELGPARQEPSADSVVAVPLVGERAVLGVLAVYDPLGGRADLTTLRTLADQAAVAVENVLRHQDMSRLAVTDALTGLANYRSFTATLTRELERATRYGRTLALLLLDVDHFKRVNDTHGHQRGDAVLVELAARVASQVRDVDTVARYGGEELVVVLPETDLSGAELAAERIRRAVRDQPFGIGPDAVVVTVSLGVAVHPADGQNATALLRTADEALYEAKRAGRDTWRSRRRPADGAGADPADGPPHLG